MRRAVIFITVGAVVLLCGTLLYRHFVRIKSDIRNKSAYTEGKTGKPSFSAGKAAQTEPDAAELYSFSWNQSSENADACFAFFFGTAQEDTNAERHYLNCTFRTSDGESAEYTGVPVTDKQWSEFDTALRGLYLPTYVPPDPYLLDATDSCIEVCRANTGERFTRRYNGEYAHELRTFLMTFISQITE